MLLHRLVTGGLLIAGLVALVWLDAFIEARTGRKGVAIGGAALLILVPLLAREVAALLRGSGSIVPTWLALIAGTGGLVSTTGIPGEADPAAHTTAVAMMGVAGVAFLASAARRNPRGAAATVGGALLAFVICGVLPGFWVRIRVEFGAEVFAACILVVKASDTGAYFGGRLFGRHKLIPWLSPGKTWEGFVFGIVSAAAVATLFAWLWSGRTWVPPIGAAVVGGAVLGLVGAGGDLAESLLKREAGAKDSGRVLPGMGGIFDVLDSLLPVAPIAWLLLRAAAVQS